VADTSEDGAPVVEGHHELLRPFERNGEMVKDITLRRPKMKDMKKIAALRGTDADKAASMIALLSGWAPLAVDELDGADVDAISKIIDSFS
jgi:hypothetical protein